LDTEAIKPPSSDQENGELSDRSEFPENQEEALMAKIRYRFSEIEELIEDMKSKLPVKSQ
jgi:hypothetical protein